MVRRVTRLIIESSGHPLTTASCRVLLKEQQAFFDSQLLH
jgi:hypothetical protein